MHYWKSGLVGLCLVVGTLFLSSAVGDRLIGPLVDQLPVTRARAASHGSITTIQATTIQATTIVTSSLYLPFIHTGQPIPTEPTVEPTTVPTTVPTTQPTTQPTPQSWIRAATVETTPVPNSGDAADDPAI